MWQADFRALSCDVRVVADEGADVATLRALTRGYAPAEGPPSLVYRLGADGRVERDGVEVSPGGEPLDAIPLFEGDLYPRLVARAPDGWTLHAAALADDRGAVVLAGREGAGKSTLCAALLRRGLRYLGDDVAWCRGGRCEAIARPISFSRGIDPALTADLEVVRYPLRLVQGTREHFLALPPPERVGHGPFAARVLVALEYAPGEEPGATALTPGEALTALWPLTLSGGRQAWSHALEAARATPAARLRTRRVDEACDEVLRLLDRV